MEDNLVHTVDSLVAHMGSLVHMGDSLVRMVDNLVRMVRSLMVGSLVGIPVLHQEPSLGLGTQLGTLLGSLGSLLGSQDFPLGSQGSLQLYMQQPLLLLQSLWAFLLLYQCSRCQPPFRCGEISLWVVVKWISRKMEFLISGVFQCLPRWAMGIVSR